MSLISLVITLVVIGVLLYLLNTYVSFIDPKIKRIINIVVLVAVVLWLMYAFGIMDGLRDVKVPRLR